MDTTSHQQPVTRRIAIEASHVSKRFGHVEALRDASIRVSRGEVVALFGDNGAGKSTFLRILQGLHRPDRGHVAINDEVVTLSSVRDAQMLGVDTVHQDLAMAPDLSVVDNMFFGSERSRRGVLGALGVLDRRAMEEATAGALERLSIRLPSLRIPVRELSGGQRQAVAVARAVMRSPTAVLMDEPTAALGARQSENVCRLIGEVAASGRGVLVVSHDLPRILAVADRVVVLLRGKTALDEQASALSVPDVVAAMVGYGSEPE